LQLLVLQQQTQECRVSIIFPNSGIAASGDAHDQEATASCRSSTAAGAPSTCCCMQP
jgi:hypothetical protein